MGLKDSLYVPSGLIYLASIITTPACAAGLALVFRIGLQASAALGWWCFGLAHVLAAGYAAFLLWVATAWNPPSKAIAASVLCIGVLWAFQSAIYDTVSVRLGVPCPREVGRLLTFLNYGSMFAYFGGFLVVMGILGLVRGRQTPLNTH